MGNPCVLMQPLVVALFSLTTLTLLANAGVSRGMSASDLGLYNASDKVIILTSASFKNMVLGKNYSSLVEFYNSYCGHCKRFAPHYKELAEEVYSWRDVFRVCAIDCAVEENNDVCREYEVMAYPTLRYIGPGFEPSAEHYGQSIATQKVDEIRSYAAALLASENRTANMTAWPNLNNVTESYPKALFEGLDSQRQHIILVWEPENSTLGIELALQYLRWPAIQVRRVTDPEIAAKFKMDSVSHKIATVNRQGTVTPHDVPTDNITTYSEVIANFLSAHGIIERPDDLKSTVSTTTSPINDGLQSAIIAEVKRQKHLIYQADLELAIRNVIFVELPKESNINGEKLLALQNILSILNRYSPLGQQGRDFMSKLYEFVMQHNQSLSGKEFEDEARRLEKQLTPVFTATHYVGCAASRQGLRGFTCSLWSLFHYLTVQAATREHSQDPLEVLQAIHGFVKFFFGCTECAQHFQAMAARRKIWNTPNKDEAVLWLWAAHNEVNNRLAGDTTEDPEFPKIQFPSESSCQQCYRHPITSPANLDIDWNKAAVLSFLKNIHNPEFVSRFALDVESVPIAAAAERFRQKRTLSESSSSVFSDVDMRMGMLLYGFCVIMLFVAFKLFAFKGGYRRKVYGHDVLGKV